MFRKLRLLYSYSSYEGITKLKDVFPELRNLSYDELGDRWKQLGVNLYSEKITPVNKLVRLTMPFAIILIILMFIFIPFNFLITGTWTYKISKGIIYNWFKSLKLI